MFHKPLEAGTEIHPAWCGCPACTTPAAQFRGAATVISLALLAWAIVFGLIFGAFYLFAAFHARDIAAAFGWSF